VVCGIVKKDEEGIIACQREKSPYAGFWEFPGGKVEHGETKRQSLSRELKEELNITVSIDKYVMVRKYRYDGLTIHLYAYICTYLRGDIRITEHQSFKVMRMDELLNLNFLEGNKKIIKRLIYLEKREKL